MYLLDTDICSYLMGRGYKNLESKFLAISPDDLATSAIVQAEIWYGLSLKNVGLQRRLAAAAFFESIKILDWPSNATHTYGRLRAMLKEAGTPIDYHDTMIAAHAIALDAILVTNNIRHFSRIGSPLRIENWLGK